MSIKIAIASIVAANSSVTNLVGDRIYPVVLPEDAERPAITYKRLPSGHEHNLKGGSGRSTGRFRFTCWADTFAKADQTGDALRLCLDGFAGTVAGTQITNSSIVSDFDEFDAPIDGSAVGLFQVIHDYDIQYVESLPNN